jgi:hypothetical protein
MKMTKIRKELKKKGKRREKKTERKKWNIVEEKAL